jgi:hypothetical protein
MTVVRLPIRSSIWIVENGDDGPWVVLAPGNHGWVHGDEQSAQADAAWLAKNFDLPIRSAAS